MALRNSWAMPADISPSEASSRRNESSRSSLFTAVRSSRKTSAPRRVPAASTTGHGRHRQLPSRGGVSPHRLATQGRLAREGAGDGVGDRRPLGERLGRRRPRAESGSPRSVAGRRVRLGEPAGGLDDEEPSRVRPDEGLRGDGEGVGAGFRAPAHLFQLAGPAPQLLDGARGKWRGRPAGLPGSTPPRRALRLRGRSRPGPRAGRGAASGAARRGAPGARRPPGWRP